MDNEETFLEVLNPVAPTKMAVSEGDIAIRTVDGKRIGLFWNRKPKGDFLLSRFGELIKDQFKNVKIELLQGKYDPAQSAPMGSLDEAKGKCDAVILATGD